MKQLRSLVLIVSLLFTIFVPAMHALADTGPNLIANPSAELTDSSGNPLNWTANSRGTNNASLTVSSNAHTGANSLAISTTSYTSGDAKWIPDAVAVTAGQQYTYADYYESSVATEVDAVYYDASNNASYVYLLTTPASSTWQNATVTFTAPATAVRASIMHILSSAGSLTIDDASLATYSPTPPPPPSGNNLIANPSLETANGSTPAGWQTGGWGTNNAQFTYTTSGHTGSRSVLIAMTSYTSGDAKWYFNEVPITGGTPYTFSDYYESTVTTSLVAQFDNGSGVYSYQALGNVSPSSSWNQVSATFTAPTTAKFVTIFHVLSAVGSLQTDDYLLAPTQSVPNISLTNPAPGSTLSGSVTLAANASAPQGVASVQFMLDGVNLGSPVAASPYQISWNTITATNGTHVLSAVLTTTDNQTATSGTVQVTINNATPGTNLIPNPSLETVNPTNKNLPLGWSQGGWGTNTRTYTYATNGHTGSRSIKTTITSFTNGASYWSYGNTPVVGGQMYDFTDYYKSSVESEIDLAYTMNDGSTVYAFAGESSPSPNSWTKFRSQFTAPIGAVSVNLLHDIYQVGWLQTDDYSLTTFSYQGFNRAIVSLTFDDGYASFYNNGLPLLQKYGFLSTDYIITSTVDTDPAYMTSAMIKGLNAAGNEIGSHTVTHPDLTTLSATAMDGELKNSQIFLQQLLGKPIIDFASPYGAYNQQVVTDAEKYYQSYRGVMEGYNAKNNFDIDHLMVQNIVSTTTTAQVASWVAEAQATNTWLILVYHQVDTDPAAGDYNTYPSDLDAELANIKGSGVAVETVAQALNEIKPQL